MNDKVFQDDIEKLGIILNTKQVKLFQDYKKFLIDYNQNVNLTRIVENEEINLKHYYDSAIAMKYVDFKNISTLVDVGTGAGFPGIVLKILFPHLKVILLESNNKKCEFLKKLITMLKLDEVIVINERAEIFAKMNKDKYDIVISRAVANLKVLSELCLPLVKVGGNFIAMKGAYDVTSGEITSAQKRINELNSNVISINKTLLFNNDNERTIIVIKKEKPTPSRFPRDYKTIIKND